MPSDEQREAKSHCDLADDSCRWLTGYLLNMVLSHLVWVIQVLFYNIAVQNNKKSQIASTKIQTNHKLQAPNNK